MSKTFRYNIDITNFSWQRINFLKLQQKMTKQDKKYSKKVSRVGELFQATKIPNVGDVSKDDETDL